jgi:hypothetical protein
MKKYHQIFNRKSNQKINAMAKYAVLHLEKGAGNDAPISSHIERTVNPSNADKDRTHLNRELIEFPDGVRNRTEQSNTGLNMRRSPARLAITKSRQSGL